MVEAQVWTLIGLLATALFVLIGQLRGFEGQQRALERSLLQRLADLTLEMNRGFGEIRGDIAVIKAQINRDGQ